MGFGKGSLPIELKTFSFDGYCRIAGACEGWGTMLRKLVRFWLRRMNFPKRRKPSAWQTKRVSNGMLDDRNKDS